MTSSPFFGSVEASGNFEDITPNAENKQVGLPSLSLEGFALEFSERNESFTNFSYYQLLHICIGRAVSCF